MGKPNREGLLAAAQRAEIGQPPDQADQTQQTLDELRHVPQRHAKEHLDRQAGLDGSIALALRSAAGWTCIMSP
jgi:hypothetical protein